MRALRGGEVVRVSGAGGGGLCVLSSVCLSVCCVLCLWFITFVSWGEYVLSVRYSVPPVRVYTQRESKFMSESGRRAPGVCAKGV